MNQTPLNWLALKARGVVSERLFFSPLNPANTLQLIYTTFSLLPTPPTHPPRLGSAFPHWWTEASPQRRPRQMFEPPVEGNLKPSGDVKMETRPRSRYRSPPKTRTEGGRRRMQCRGALVSRWCRRALTDSGCVNYKRKKTEGMILFERFSHHILLLKLFVQVQNRKIYFISMLMN